jgi:hypothetical protein
MMIKAALWLSVGLLCGCSSTVLVRVPPRVDMHAYGTTGVVLFASNAEGATNEYATQQFQQQVQAAQPGTRFVELGSRESVLAAVGATQLDVEAIKRIGKKFGVAAVFHGHITYSEPTTNVRVTDLSKLHGGVKSEIKGDIFGRLLETSTGASVWSSSAWMRKPIAGLVSGEHGVSLSMKDSNPRYDMVPTLVYHLTNDFRATTTRQKAD